MKKNFGTDAEIELIAGENGVFEIRAGGGLVFSKKQSGHFPEEGEILRLIREQSFA